MTRDELVAAVSAALGDYNAALFALEVFDRAPEQNVFETLEEAAGVLEDKMRDIAHADCEGSYNCGQETYEQEFIVGGVHYRGVLAVEYNRHDKTYYYIDSARFSCKELSPLDGAPI